MIAPWREWDIVSREDAIDYAEARGIPVPATRKDLYSRDRNLWHLSHEGGPLEDPAHERPSHRSTSSRRPDAGARRARSASTIGFEAGIPVSVDGRRLAPVELVRTLNAIGGGTAWAGPTSSRAVSSA